TSFAGPVEGQESRWNSARDFTEHGSPEARPPSDAFSGIAPSAGIPGTGTQLDPTWDADAMESPFHFTSTRNVPDEEDDTPGSGYFSDSIPEIRPNDPVTQLGPVGAVPVTVEPFEPARILARVGSEVILAGDL